MPLPVNIDSSYADDPDDPSVKAHQQAHDQLHAQYNQLEGEVITATEVNTALAGKADTGHGHDFSHDHTGEYQPPGDYIEEGDPRLSDARTPTAHDHDDRYYTETEVNTALAGKADVGHTHEGGGGGTVVTSGTNLDSVGVPGNGTDDASAAFQQAIDDIAAAGGGVLIMPNNRRYRLTTSLIWKTNVSLVGQGWGVGGSVLAPEAEATGIERNGGSTSDTLDDCRFEGFEVDCSAQDNGGAGYTSHIKGMYMLYMRRALFRNLYIHDSLATGLGCDYLPDSLIENCLVERGGRLYTGAAGQYGSSGIGIGTGAWLYENVKVVNCTARDNGNHGIFFEKQQGLPNFSRGIKVIGCYATGNKRGFADIGCDGAIFSDCHSFENDEYGFTTGYSFTPDEYGVNGVFDNCHAWDNGEDGYMLWGNGSGGYTIRNGSSYSNSGWGIRTQSNSTAPGEGLPDVTIENMKVLDNSSAGIYTKNLTERLRLLHNVVRGNGVYSEAPGREGLRLVSLIDGGQIIGNRVDAQAGAAGILLHSTGSFVNGDMHGNDFRGAGTITLDGPLTDSAIYDNLGIAEVARPWG